LNLGILGGTFDPPHIGHLIVAEQARAQLQLDEVWFAPAGQPPHKRNRKVSKAEHRVAMTRLAIADNPHFKLCLADIKRPGPHYSTDLMRLLRLQHPRNQWYFIIGGDSLADLPNWHQPQQFVQLARLAVAHRPGFQPDLAALEQTIPGLSQRVAWVNSPLVYVSSSDLRARARQGLPLHYVVPGEVEAYVQQHRLYA
jgi:nicotinate-nucleotide adenylyltransferase